jgi:hypothetical protein
LDLIRESTPPSELYNLLVKEAMRPTDENLNSPAFTGASSPFIFDPDVDAQLQEADLKFFDDAVAHTTPTSGVRIVDEFFSSPSENRGTIEPAPSPVSLARAQK